MAALTADNGGLDRISSSIPATSARVPFSPDSDRASSACGSFPKWGVAAGASEKLLDFGQASLSTCHGVTQSVGGLERSVC